MNYQDIYNRLGEFAKEQKDDSVTASEAKNLQKHIRILDTYSRIISIEVEGKHYHAACATLSAKGECVLLMLPLIMAFDEIAADIMADLKDIMVADFNADEELYINLPNDVA